MATWRDALREYWQWKAEALLNESRLREFRKRMAHSGQGRREDERIGRIQAYWLEKKLESLKVACRVRIIKVREGEEEVEAVVSVAERNLCRDNRKQFHLDEEQRLHRIHLKKVKQRWRVLEDVPLAENMMAENHGEIGNANAAGHGRGCNHDGEPGVNAMPAQKGGTPESEKLSPVRSPEGRRGLFRLPGKAYRRDLAVRYAESWWNGHHPNFRAFDADCTNFVSQCLLAGGAPMTHVGQKDKGWWYLGDGGPGDRWSFSWAVAHSLRWYLKTSSAGLRAVERKAASELEPGDVICYDFDGDGRWQHTAIVVAVDSQGEPLVNAHTASVRRKHWSYRHSYAWTEHIQYQFFHIVDEF